MRDHLHALNRIGAAALFAWLTFGAANAPAQTAKPQSAKQQTAKAQSEKAHAGTADSKTKPAPTVADEKPNPKAGSKKAAAVPAPHEASNAPASGDRAMVQYDLAWIGAYNGLINGEANDKTTAAIKAFQKDHRFKDTGALEPPERAALAASSKERQDQVGWRMVEDKVTSAEIGLPTKQVPNSGAGRSGTRWFSTQGQIQVETFRIREPGVALADVFEQQKKEPPGRHVEVNFLRPDFFILSGMQGLKKFYVRAEIRDGEVRGMTILYDQATEGIMDPLVVVMSSAFAPFAGSGIAALAGTPQRRRVEYGSGLTVTVAGDILSDRRLTDGCNIIEIAGRGNAEQVAVDEVSGLALLRVYGVPDLAPAALAQESASGGELTLLGIADPQSQGGGNAVSTVTARLNGDTLTPTPPAGFDGAAVVDGNGRLLGIVAMKDAVVASAGTAALPATGNVVPLTTLRQFLDTRHVAATTGAAGIDAAKAAVVRVICVRR